MCAEAVGEELQEDDDNADAPVPLEAERDVMYQPEADLVINQPAGIVTFSARHSSSGPDAASPPAVSNCMAHYSATTCRAFNCLQPCPAPQLAAAEAQPQPPALPKPTAILSNALAKDAIATVAAARPGALLPPHPFAGTQNGKLIVGAAGAPTVSFGQAIVRNMEQGATPTA